MVAGKKKANPKASVPDARVVASREATLADVLIPLSPQCFDTETHLNWPPETFVLASVLLRASGGYRHVIDDWPPRRGGGWSKWIKSLGLEWRSSVKTAPPEIVRLWAAVVEARDRPIHWLRTDRVLCHKLLELVAAADEASVGVGLPRRKPDRFHRAADHALIDTLETPDGSTLSPRIPASLARSLPKQHTPAGGLTLRSLTHNLALHVGGDVVPRWSQTPACAALKQVNIVVAPWPLELERGQFSETAGNLENMPPRFRFVELQLRTKKAALKTYVTNLIAAAKRIAGSVHGVVFPELSLTQADFDAVAEVVLAENAFLVGGVSETRPSPRPSRNKVVFCTPVSRLEQDKHHRWRLDRPQIEGYGLDGVLDPSRDWWEYIEVGRQLNFYPLYQDVTFCCLVCEDLARLEPVGELIRSVGPNLVIALLMDAPQLQNRWPARYATVLADDPGSSVLTVTSAGMVDMSTPPVGMPVRRTIALWKDPRSGIQEIDLPVDAQGVLLTLKLEESEEFSADGRTDGGVTLLPRLASWRPLRT